MVTKKLKIVSLAALIALSGQIKTSAVGTSGQLLGMVPKVADVAGYPLSLQTSLLFQIPSFVLGMSGFEQSDVVSDVSSGLQAVATGADLVGVGMSLDQPSNLIIDSLNAFSLGSTACSLATLCAASRYGALLHTICPKVELAAVCPKFALPAMTFCSPLALKLAVGASLLYGGKRLADSSVCKPIYAKMKAGYNKVKNIIHTNPVLKYGTYGSMVLYSVLSGMKARENMIKSMMHIVQKPNVVTPVVDYAQRMADVCML